MQIKYRILSPDGFDINPDCGFKTIKEARGYLRKWIEGFSGQGYYSQICSNGYNRRISLNELPDYCELIKI